MSGHKWFDLLSAKNCVLVNTGTAAVKQAGLAADNTISRWESLGG